MRRHRLRACDTLRKIARSKYYVYDDRGDEDEDRVRTVVREIIKWNPNSLDLFKASSNSAESGNDRQRDDQVQGDLLSRAMVDEVWNNPFGDTQQCGAPSDVWITLPDVPGISVYDTAPRPILGWWGLYVLLWLLVSLGIVGFSLAQKQLTTGENVLNAPRHQLLNGDSVFWHSVNDVLPYLCLWSLTIWGAWLVFRPATASPVRRARQRFLLGWIFGLLVLLPSLSLLINIVVPRAAPSLTPFNDLFPLVVIWTVIIFLLYLYLSDGSVVHAEYLVPHRGIWTVLALMLMGTTLAGYIGYQQVTDRIHGELSALTLARSSLVQLRGSARTIRDTLDDSLHLSQIRSAPTPTSEQQAPTGVQQISTSVQQTPTSGQPGQIPTIDSNSWLMLEQEAASAAFQARDTQTYIQEAIRHYRDSSSFLGQASQAAPQPGAASSALAATGAITGTQADAQRSGADTSYLRQQIDALEQISTIMAGMVAETNTLSSTLSQIAREPAPITGTNESVNIRQAREALRQAQDIAAKADVAAASMTGIAFDGLPIFVWNGVLYAALVLFPWLLLLLFLYRKRVNLAAQIYNDLHRLDPSEGLLKRVLKGNSARREQQHVERLLDKDKQADAHPPQPDATAGQTSPAPDAQNQAPQVAAAPQTQAATAAVETAPAVSPAGRPGQPGNTRLGKQMIRRLKDWIAHLFGPRGSVATGAAIPARQQVVATVGQGPPPPPPSPAPQRPPEREQEIVDVLAKRTFGEFEYLISIVFLTLLLAVGWYYVFYPQTSIGLTFLIERGAGVRQLLAFLTTNLTPLTMGFAGAYFFLMEMLVRRYLANDLYPTAFLQAALRLLVTFLLSLALTLLPTLGVDPNAYIFTNNQAATSVIALLVAFVVGIYPTSGLKLILTTVNRWLRRPLFPTTLVSEPLTKLTGVTLWVEARLFEENIESIEAMATAQMEQLIVNTHFSTGQIVDWVDQAILYLHCGHESEWFPQLRAVGIRSASDLLDAAGLNLLSPYESLEQSCAILAPDAQGQLNTPQRYEFCPDSKALQIVVNAIAEANASGVPRPSLEDPRGVAASLMENVRREGDHGAALARRAAELIEQIDLKKPETYSYPKQIDAAVAQARTALDAITGALPGLEQAASQPGLASAEPSLPQNIAQLQAAVEQAKTLAQQIPAIDTTPPPGAPAGVAPIAPSSPSADDVMLNDPQPIKPQIIALHKALNAAASLLDAIEQATARLGRSAADQAKQQALATSLADLRAKWEPLKAIESAEQQAQRLDASQPATYDARADLAHTAEQLLAVQQTLDSGLAQVRKIVTQKDITMTRSQGKTVEPALESAEQGLKALRQPIEQTYNYSRQLSPRSSRATAPTPARKDEAALIGETFASAHEKLQFLDTALAAIVQPPQVTVDILQVICDTIWPDPNIAYILNYNTQTIEDLARRQ